MLVLYQQFSTSMSHHHTIPLRGEAWWNWRRPAAIIRHRRSPPARHPAASEWPLNKFSAHGACTAVGFLRVQSASPFRFSPPRSRSAQTVGDTRARASRRTRLAERPALLGGEIRRHVNSAVKRPPACILKLRPSSDAPAAAQQTASSPAYNQPAPPPPPPPRAPPGERRFRQQKAQQQRRLLDTSRTDRHSPNPTPERCRIRFPRSRGRWHREQSGCSRSRRKREERERRSEMVTRRRRRTYRGRSASTQAHRADETLRITSRTRRL